MPLQDEYVRTSLRLPPDLHEQLLAAASKADRSLNDELIARLKESFDRQPLEARLVSIEHLLSQLLKKGK
jgi:hypothetical protein